MSADDSEIGEQQRALIRWHARKALERADALGRFPTPVQDVMAAASLVVGEDELSDGFLAKLRKNAFRAGKVLKSAISKVLGVLDHAPGIVYLAKGIHAVQQIFLKLHEAGHALLPWQRDLYYAVQDCDKTIAPEVSEMFEREANVFASEVLFQLDTFTNEAADYDFGLRVPLKLSKKYGASVYSTVRRYVSTHDRKCVVLVFNPPNLLSGDGFHCSLRRVIASPSFLSCFGRKTWPKVLTADDFLGRLIPLGDRKMSWPRKLRITDRNLVQHECVGEVFRYKYYVFILICDVAALTHKTIVVP